MEWRLSYGLATWRVTETLPLILAACSLFVALCLRERLAPSSPALLPQNPGDVIEDHQVEWPDCEGEGSQRVGRFPALPALLIHLRLCLNAECAETRRTAEFGLRKFLCEPLRLRVLCVKNETVARYKAVGRWGRACERWPMLTSSPAVSLVAPSRAAFTARGAMLL